MSIKFINKEKVVKIFENKFSVAIILILIVTLIFSSLTIVQAKTQKQIDVLRLSGGDSGFLSPFACSARGGGLRRTLVMYDGLLERNKEGFVPWLAEDYEIKNGGKQYLFTIREGIKWHDGKPLTVEDVKFTFEYTDKHPMVRQWVLPGDIENIEIVNGNKVLFTVTEPKVTNLYNLGRTHIIPKHVWENVKNPKEYLEEDALIGSGPYKLVEYNRAHETYHYKAFDQFWGPTPAFKEIEVLPVNETVMAFERKEIDYFFRAPADLLKRYKSKDEFKIMKGRCFGGSRLLFNMKDYPIFRQKKFRQAIMYALDSEEFIEKIARGAGVLTNAGILPPDHVMYNPKVKKYGYKPQKAKELLNELEYDQINKNGIRKNKNGDELSFTLLSMGKKGARKEELIKEQLAKIGIEIKVYIVDRSKHDDLVMNDKYQMDLYGHASLGRDADYLRRRYGKNASSRKITNSMGSSGYKNEELIKLLEEQQKEFNYKKRKKILFKIQEILAEEVPAIPLYFEIAYDIYRPTKYDGWEITYDSKCALNSIFSYLLEG